MKYFDFVISEVHGLRIKELMDAKAQGRKVVGSYCVFVPEELILAVDGVSVGLCAGAEFNFEAAETVLPRNLCPLIKSAFGFKQGRVCPYVEASDVVVGENTCDGKKKAYEVLAPMVKDLYVIDLPQMKSDAGKDLLRAEYRKFMNKLEDVSGRKITVAGLKSAIETTNAKRRAVKRLDDLRKSDPRPYRASTRCSSTRSSSTTTRCALRLPSTPCATSSKDACRTARAHSRKRRRGCSCQDVPWPCLTGKFP